VIRVCCIINGNGQRRGEERRDDIVLGFFFGSRKNGWLSSEIQNQAIQPPFQKKKKGYWSWSCGLLLVRRDGRRIRDFPDGMESQLGLLNGV
jgi:hypothetical protein